MIPAPLNMDEQKAADDFAYLLDAFRDVLVDLGEAEIAAALPWGERHDPSAEPDDPDRLTQALSIAFRLATLAEENAVTQFRRNRESADGLTAVSGSWGRILSDLREAGHEPAAIATRLSGIAVEPVLTAHPTEAKRATVLEQHRELYLLLVSREYQRWTPAEQAETDAEPPGDVGTPVEDGGDLPGTARHRGRVPECRALPRSRLPAGRVPPGRQAPLGVGRDRLRTRAAERCGAAPAPVRHLGRWGSGRPSLRHGRRDRTVPAFPAGTSDRAARRRTRRTRHPSQSVRPHRSGAERAHLVDRCHGNRISAPPVRALGGAEPRRAVAPGDQPDPLPASPPASRAATPIRRVPPIPMPASSWTTFGE